MKRSEIPSGWFGIVGAARAEAPRRSCGEEKKMGLQEYVSFRINGPGQKGCGVLLYGRIGCHSVVVVVVVVVVSSFVSGGVDLVTIMSRAQRRRDRSHR